MSQKHFLTKSLQYYCILGLAEIKTLHPRNKIMRKRCRLQITAACVNGLLQCSCRIFYRPATFRSQKELSLKNTRDMIIHTVFILNETLLQNFGVQLWTNIIIINEQRETAFRRNQNRLDCLPEILCKIKCIPLRNHYIRVQYMETGLVHCVLGQMWYLIESIPDICLLSYFS